MKEESIDLILSDIKMPEMEGTEFVEEVRKSDDKIPIIFISGAAEREDVVRCLNLGAFSLIEKPFEEHTVEMHVKNALRLKGILDAVVKLSSLNFRAYVASTKISKMTDSTKESDRKRTRDQLETILDEISSLTNLVLSNTFRKVS